MCDCFKCDRYQKDTCIDPKMAGHPLKKYCFEIVEDTPSEKDKFIAIIEKVRGYNFGLCEADYVLDVIMANVKEMT